MQGGPTRTCDLADDRPGACLSSYLRGRQLLHAEQGQCPPNGRRRIQPPWNRLARNHGEHGAAPAKKASDGQQDHLGRLPRSRRSQELPLTQPMPNDPETRSRRTAGLSTYRADAWPQHVHPRHRRQPLLDRDLAVHDCLKRSVPFVSFHVGCGSRPGGWWIRPPGHLNHLGQRHADAPPFAAANTLIPCRPP